MLFPYNHERWLKIAHNKYSLDQSYKHIQLCNLYKMYFSLNRNYLYEDLKDFNLFLEKFSFIRFFNGIFETSSHPKSLKYS